MAHFTFFITLRAKLSGAVYCNRSCLRVCNGRVGGRAVWVCYHDNSKMCASILIKLGLYFVGIKVVTISSRLNFGRPAPPRRVCGGANFFGSALLQPARSVCVSLCAFSFLSCFYI